MTSRNLSIISAFAALLASTFSLHAQSGLTAETWNNLTQGDSVIILQQEGISNRAADATATITDANLAGPTAAGTGTRLRGSVTPGTTDTYTFWINGSDNVALWISDDASRFNKKLVAYNLGTTNVGEWDKHANQKSIPIQLTGGQSYYLEAQVMDKDGGGHVAVAWRGQKGRYALDLNGAIATQSSTKWGKEASNAIDGDIDGNWGIATLTNNELNSWWQVDFGQDREINQVVLYNTTTNQDRLSNFRISVLDANDVELIGQDFFTTTGNVGDNMIWDLPSSQPTVRKIKIQLLGYNLAGNGNLALAEVEAYGAGLVTGQVNHREIISQAVLNTLAADADDTNDNNLSDTWETQTGLDVSALPGALLEYGDPDNDGLSNYQEQWIGSDPLVKEALVNGLTRYIWMGINGSLMTNLTKNSKFYSYPNAIDHVPGVDDSLNRTLFGARYRGAIVAPTTGDYRFWISGDGGGAELWLSDGTIKDAANNPLTNRFGKRFLAESGYITPKHDFDYSPEQRSELIHLVQGQEYYVEVLHTVQNGQNDHVSIAWQAPGGSREIIPNTIFLSNDPLASDADDDNLPDAWETANALDPTENGFNDLNESEYGDPDADGLTNLEEYQNGTDPKNADSDGDGYSDSEEVNYYGSDPLTSNNLAPIAITLPALNQFTAATGAWNTDSNGSLVAQDRRGGITYTFTVAEAGVHEVVVEVGAVHPIYWYTRNLSLSLTLDNDSAPFANDVLQSNNNTTDTMRAITPWLTAGMHSVTIYHDNFEAALRIRIDSVSIQRLGGDDLDEDGIPDWLEAKAALENTLTRVPAESRTSPVSIEGITEQITSTTLSVLAPGASEADDVPVTGSINDSFFADVPLSEAGAVTLDASFVSGLATESHGITWTATNLFDSFTADTLHIRQGDSLRLDAWSGAAADGLPFTVTLDGTLLADSNQNTSHTSGVPFTSTFATAGSYTLVATHDSQTATVTLEVHGADFGVSHIVQINKSRTWTPPTLDTTAIVEADERIVFTETTTTGARNFLVKADEPINRNVIARLPDDLDGAPSAILAQGTVHAFDVAGAGQTNDAQVVTQYADGTWLMSHTVVAVNLPPGVFIKVTIKNQGSLYTNGSDVIELRAEDFDANGIAALYYEAPDSTIPPKLCHITTVYVEL